MHVGVLADDFTGAIDTGVSFAGWGYDVRFYLDDDLPDQETDIIVRTSLSREIPQELAIARTWQLALEMKDRRLFKKIDSTMRGHVAPEIHAMLQVTGIPAAVICPATIETGRTIENGQLYVHGQLLTETAFAHDPCWPAASALIGDLLRDQQSVHIGLSTVRQGVAGLSAVFSQATSALITVDATTHDDLLTIASATLQAELLPCGAMGFCKAWIQVIHGGVAARQRPSIPLQNQQLPLLLVIGSVHPANQQQIASLERQMQSIRIQLSAGCSLAAVERDLLQALQQSPLVLLQMPAARIADSETLRTLQLGLARMVQSVLQQVKIAGLVVVGGETAAAIASALQISAIQILHEIEAGVPLGRMIGGQADSLLIVTKAGGFGSEQTLGSIAEWFGAREERNEG